MVTGKVARALFGASAKPTSALTVIRTELLTSSRPWQTASTATFFLATTTRASALLELYFAEHDLPGLVAVRRLVRRLCLGEHLQAALHRGSRVDLLEPALDVGIL